LPIAKKIPYEINDSDYFSEEICFLYGHILAEGWTTEHDRYYTSGREIDEHIIPILEANNIPFSRHINNSNVPYITFFQSSFRETLRPLLFNSFDIRIPPEVFYLPENKIQKFMDGYFLGDGHYENDGVVKCYSTSCESFAMDLQRLALQCGYSFNGYEQLKHGGVGTKPIWRMIQNPKSRFLTNHGYKDISEVGINKFKVRDNGLLPMRDFAIADTHTFIFKNGLIAHQCDAFSLSCAELLIRLGADPTKVRIVFCYTETGGGHLVCIADGWVLDNRQRDIIRWDKLPYKWVKSMRLNDPGVWRIADEELINELNIRRKNKE